MPTRFPRLRRLASHALLGGSTLILVLVAAVGIRSFFVTERLILSVVRPGDGTRPGWSGYTDWCITTSRGSAALDRFRVEYRGGIAGGVRWNYVREAAPAALVRPSARGDRVNLRFAGVQFVTTASGNAVHATRLTRLVLPAWLVLLAAALPPLRAWRRGRRSGRAGFPVSQPPPRAVDAGPETAPVAAREA